MRAGMLRERIIIQQSTDTIDSDYGEIVKSWGALATLWAGLVSNAALERFSPSAQREQTTETVGFRIRYLATITQVMRVSWNSNIYNIRSIVDPDGRHHEMILICERVS